MSLLFNNENGILTFITRTMKYKEHAYSRQILLNLIHDLLENFPNYLTEYIDKIRVIIK